MNISHTSDTAYPAERVVTISALADVGLTVEDVYRSCPSATRYTALDGSPAWLLAELVPLLSATCRGGDQ